MQNENAEVRYCPTPGCGKKLRRDNTKGKCGYCSAGMKKHLKPVGGSQLTAIRTEGMTDDELLMGEAAEPAKQAPRKKPTLRKLLKDPVTFVGGVEKLRLVAEALGFNADAVLDELAGEWLITVGNQVREAADV